MAEERYSPFQLIPDRNKSNTGSQGRVREEGGVCWHLLRNDWNLPRIVVIA